MTTEKGLLSLVRAGKQVEKTNQEQPVQTGGSLNFLEEIPKGTVPSEGVAQKTTVRKWYAYLIEIAAEIKLTEECTKVSNYRCL